MSIVFAICCRVRKDKKRWDVVTSRRRALVARRCAGSRLPDHARCSSFVRSRHHARVRPRRAIRLFVGSIWRALQHSHNHVWPRTTFSMGEQAADQERGRQRQRIPNATYDLRARLAQRRLRLIVLRAAGPQHLLATTLLPACCHILA